MNVFVTDVQDVPSTEDVLFSILQQGSVQCLLTLRNIGASIIQYRFQQTADGTTWTDLGLSGTDYNNTLTASPSQSILIRLGPTTYPTVRLMGSASGGSTLEFTVTRLFNRSSGGALPLMAF